MSAARSYAPLAGLGNLIVSILSKQHTATSPEFGALPPPFYGENFLPAGSDSKFFFP
jgi:hypothetical protein